MRKRTNYVEDSIKTKCGEVAITIKPFLITRKKVSKAVRKNLRKTAKEFLTEYAKEKSYLHLSEEILSGDLQRQMLPKLKKVYPLSFCEIRVFEITKPTDLENIKIELKETETLTEEDKKEKETQIEEDKEEPHKEKSNKKDEKGAEAEETSKEEKEKEEKPEKKKASQKKDE